MKQKLLNSNRLRAMMLVAVMCAAFAGQAWGAEGDTHDFSQSLEQLLNNNASIASINIAQQSYPVKEVIVTYRTTQSASKFSMAVTVGSTNFGSYSSEGKKSAGTTQSFSASSTQGAIAITFTNNSGSGTGKGTLYVTNVRLVEGASAAPSYSITAVSSNNEHGTVSLTGSTITATPAAGYRYASPAYTVSPANSATVSQNGNEFSVTPSENTTVTINFERIPTHTATFSVNGNTSRTATVAEGAAITFPEAVATPTASQIPETINGYTFVGWATGTISGTTEEKPTLVTSATMSSSDVTYYAVYAEADVTYDEYQIEKTQTHQYDTWTYSGTTTDKDNYRLFGQDSYIQSASFDLSLLKEVYVYAGTFGALDTGTKKFTIKAGETTWATSNDLTTNSASTSNRITSEVSLSGTGPIRIISTVGDGSSTGLRISKVEIYTKKRIVTYSHYCTTVTALPKPVITMSDVNMTWGDDDKSVVPSATIGEESYAGSFSFSVNKAGLSVASDGKLTSSTPGTYVVTASIAATEDYQSASQTCTVTVGKQNVTLNFANDLVKKKVSDATYTQTATPTPADYDGTITYSKEGESTSADATVNSSSAAVAFSATGSVIVKATAPATDLYNGTTATYTIYVQTDPTIVVSNQTIAQGSTYTLDTSGFTSGDVSLSSSKSAIASVDELVVTGAAVGTATITVNTTETDTYVAGEASFTVTVSAPEASDTKPSADPITEFYESFDNCSATGGNDDTWSGISGGSTDIEPDESGWTYVKSAAASKCGRFGTGSDLGSATTPALALEGGVTYTLTFKAGAWDGSKESTTLSLSATNATLDKSSVTMSKGEWSNYNVTITEASDGAKITFAGSGGNNRFFLDEVKIIRPGTPITSTSVTTNGGYATYCYQYPLNLDGISGAKAYKVSSLDKANKKVKLTQITGTIKGGVPFILKSDADNASIEIPLADESDYVPEGNLLIGTLAPTFVEQTSGDYTNFAYSKNNGCFLKLSGAGNTVPANRAYLPINLGGGSVKAFSLSFDTETGINEIGSESGNTIFNLAGQRVNKAQKGLYIMNGKKVLVK